jgi:hypothetical protein
VDNPKPHGFGARKSRDEKETQGAGECAQGEDEKTVEEAMRMAIHISDIKTMDGRKALPHQHDNLMVEIKGALYRNGLYGRVKIV